MRFIDAHLHTDMIEDVQLQKLVRMGMEAAVIPSPHMFVARTTRTPSCCSGSAS